VYLRGFRNQSRTVEFPGREGEASLQIVKNHLRTRQGENKLRIVCGLAIAAILAATLWPFNPFPPNRIRWVPEADGIEFDGAGLVISKVPLGTSEIGGQGCTLELLLRPTVIKSVYTILSFYTPNNPRQFLVRQWTDGLLVSHDVVDAAGRVKRAKFDVNHAFQLGKLILVTIVSGSNGAVVYTDGGRAQVFPRFTFSQRDISGQIALGTSAVDYQPWKGQVRGLAIYSRELTPVEVFKHYKNWTTGTGIDRSDLDGAMTLYSFTEHAGLTIHNTIVSAPDLEIPRNFAVPHKARLASPITEFQASWEYVKDILLNIAGFVPLGFVVCAYLRLTRSRRKAILYTILGAATLSFVIEFLQAYIPQRTSGMTDILTNTLGAALGAALARSVTGWTILEKLGLVPAAETSVS
jgi:hypothetical protein